MGNGHDINITIDYGENENGRNDKRSIDKRKETL
jgi:hypothetical protein